MRIVSFDTSGNTVYLSLLEHNSIIDERTIAGNPADRKEVGAILMPQLDDAVKQSGWRKSDIDLVVVGVGPGSFTGIRVAVITARTLAQVLQVGLIGVSQLETIYYGCAKQQPAGIVLSTTSRQFFYQGFQPSVDDPAASSVDPGCGPLEAVVSALEIIPLWIGDESFLIQAPEHDSRTRPLPLIKNIATTQAQLAVDRLSLKGLLGESGGNRQTLAETFPWQNVLPLYLRSPSVTVKKSYAT